MPWAAQIRSRLSEEFVAWVPMADIMAGIERARAELDIVSAAALPEMVERLVRIRLRSWPGSTPESEPTATRLRPESQPDRVEVGQRRRR